MTDPAAPHDNGRVFLVGAGPGDPDLITRRGLNALRACDVVVYDRLVAPELVDEAPAAAERVYVGKDPRGRSTSQARINEVLVARALDGKVVVRLKGGDPFVFGRGGEEAQVLSALGIPFEIVPGVSSAVAVPAYAGIPVTHRGVASSFAVITAHSCGDGLAPNWPELARGPDTLVLMMGVKSLGETARKLMEAGRPGSQPTAIIEWGTTARQRTLVGTLATIAELAERAGIGPPATTVIGDVVALREAMAWLESRESGALPESFRSVT